MKILFKKENLKTTILTTLLLLLGLMFCVIPLRMFNFVETALCFVLIILGVVCIIIYCLMASEDRSFKTFVYGVLALAIGICMVLVARLFGIFLSLLIAYNGVSLIISGVKAKKLGEKSWIAELVIGIVVTTLSIVTIVLSGTNTAKGILGIFFGIIFLINGIYNLVNLIKLVKNGKNEIVESPNENKEQENLEITNTQEKEEPKETQEEKPLKD